MNHNLNYVKSKYQTKVEENTIVQIINPKWKNCSLKKTYSKNEVSFLRD